MMKVVQTIVGALMIAAGVLGWYEYQDRGWMPLVLIGLGGFFVSQSTMIAAVKAALDALKQWRGQAAP